MDKGLNFSLLEKRSDIYGSRARLWEQNAHKPCKMISISVWDATQDFRVMKLRILHKIGALATAITALT